MITKTFAQDGLTCRVTFRLAADAQSAALVGDFNLWNPAVTPLERTEDGAFGVTLALEAGRPYRFRYLVDGEQWLNDDTADGWLPNQFGTADSVIAIEAPVQVEPVYVETVVVEPAPAAKKTRAAKPRATVATAAEKPAAKTVKPAASRKPRKPAK